MVTDALSRLLLEVMEHTDFDEDDSDQYNGHVCAIIDNHKKAGETAPHSSKSTIFNLLKKQKTDQCFKSCQSLSLSPTDSTGKINTAY